MLPRLNDDEPVKLNVMFCFNSNEYYLLIMHKAKMDVIGQKQCNAEPISSKGLLV